MLSPRAFEEAKGFVGACPPTMRDCASPGVVMSVDILAALVWPMMMGRLRDELLGAAALFTDAGLLVLVFAEDV